MKTEGNISFTVIEFGFFFFSLLDEPVSSENLNGHATPSVTSEEVKVDIESPETLQEEQASAPVSTEDKTGTITSAPLPLSNWNNR